MPTDTTQMLKNLGRNDRLWLYLDEKKVGSSLRNIKNIDEDPDYAEGDDEYIGPDPVEPWQVYKATNLSFDFEETVAGDGQSIQNALDSSGLAGLRTRLRIVRETTNNDGTVSKTAYSVGRLRIKRKNPGKFEKILWSAQARLGQRVFS